MYPDQLPKAMPMSLEGEVCILALGKSCITRDTEVLGEIGSWNTQHPIALAGVFRSLGFGLLSLQSLVLDVTSKDSCPAIPRQPWLLEGRRAGVRHC